MSAQHLGGSGHGSCGCDDCEISAFTRNNYFTGKLLLERDFTDEQHYVRDKIRHHNLRLHGSGVVCGLEVIQHPATDCRNRFVRLTPGTALDCCGNETLVVTEEDVDLTTLPALAELDPADEDLHEIQLCLRYRECGTEPVPVLYDDRGCDDDRCLPNRILESFSVDAIVDPPSNPASWKGPRLVRGDDLPFDDARKVLALANGDLIVAAGTNVHRINPTTGLTAATQDLAGTVYGIDPAKGGALYVTHADSTGEVGVTVLDATTLDPGHRVPLDVTSTPVSAVASDGQLAVLFGSSGDLFVLGADLETATVTPKKYAVGPRRELLAVHPTKAIAYVAADANASIDQVDLATGSPTALHTLGAGTPTSLSSAVASETAYLVIGGSDDQLTAYNLEDEVVDGAVTLAGSAADLAGTPWAYAVAASGGQSVIQPVGLERLAANSSEAPGPALSFGGDATDVAVAPTGEAVYVAYTDPAASGVAVFLVEGGSCRDAWDALSDCDQCDQPDCIVVATIHGYRPGFAVLDIAEPPSDPAADTAAGIARIDNRAGRVRLRSTSALQSAIECLLDGSSTTGGGGTGPVGPPGKDGKDGKDGEDGEDGEDGAPGTPGTNGTNGVDGVDGVDGADGEGLEKDLTQIVTISWPHAERHPLSNMRKVWFPDPDTGRRVSRWGVMIQFSREVHVDPIDPRHVFTVEAPNVFAPDEVTRFGYLCRCLVAGTVHPVRVKVGQNGLITEGEVIQASHSDAIAFVFSDDFVGVLHEFALDDLLVRLHGEFVLDVDGRAVDAEFTRAELPSGDRPQGSEFGVQGGLFQSWFEPARD